jgi:hypothetical protein
MLLSGIFVLPQLAPLQAQERTTRSLPGGARETNRREPSSTREVPVANADPCTPVKLERRTYCRKVVLDGDQDPTIKQGLTRNVTATILEVRNINGDVTVTGATNYSVVQNVGGYTTQNQYNSIQHAVANGDVEQRGNYTNSTARNNFGVRQSVSNGYQVADDNVFVTQTGYRSHQFAGAGNGAITQAGELCTNFAAGVQMLTQGGHNSVGYYSGSEAEDFVILEANPNAGGYTGNRFITHLRSGDDYVMVQGTKITANIDGGDGADAVQLEGVPADYTVTENHDGSKTYANERRDNLITLRNVETVIIGDNFPATLAARKEQALDRLQTKLAQQGKWMDVRRAYQQMEQRQEERARQTTEREP